MVREVIDFDSERARHKSLLGRADVVARLDGWLLHPESASGWVLLTGGPGFGKSAIMAHYLTRLLEQGHKVAFHFLRRDVEDWDHPAVMYRSLSAQIESYFPAPDRAYSVFDTTSGEDSDAAAAQHMIKLLRRVSREVLEPARTRLFLVIDGLDEAAVQNSREPLPRFLLPAGVWVLCSSRPDHTGLAWLKSQVGPRMIDLSAPEWHPSNQGACSAFWQAQAGALKLAPSFVLEAQQRGAGNMLHAVMLCEWLSELSEAERRVTKAALIPMGLDGILEEMWTRLRLLPQRTRDAVRQGLGFLCAAREALPLWLLAELSGWASQDIHDDFLPAVESLLLQQPAHHRLAPEGERAYRLWHESFRAFLAKKLGSKEVQEVHRRMAREVACWPPADGNAFRRGYALRHGIAHRVQAGDWYEVERLLGRPDYLSAACVEVGVSTLESEVQHAAVACPNPILQTTWSDLWRALRAESHWLLQVPEALPQLLHNRLLCLGWGSEEISRSLSLSDAGLLLRLRHPLQRVHGASERTLSGHSGFVTCCAVTSDGSLVISGSVDGTLKVWDVQSGREQRTLSGHPNSPITACAINSDGELAVSASVDNTVKIWDLQSGRELMTLSGHTNIVTACALTLDSRFVLSGSLDHTLRTWDLRSGELLSCFGEQSMSPTALAVTPDGQHVLAASYDGTLKLWNLHTGDLIRSFTGHTGIVAACAVAPNGPYAISGAGDKLLKVWDLLSGRELFSLSGHTDAVSACAVSSDGRRAVSGSFDKTLKVWDLATRQEITSLAGHSDAVTVCALTRGGEHVISGSRDKTLKVWDLQHKQRLPTATGHLSPVVACAVMPNDWRAVSASIDEELRTWDLQTGQEIRSVSGHPFPAPVLAVAADGGLVVSGSYDGRLRVRDVWTGHEIRQFAGHSMPITACAMTPDGRRVVSASYDQTLRIWDFDSGAISSLRGHSLPLTACALTANGQLAISASYDRTLKVWDSERGLELLSLTCQAGAATACGVSADGLKVFAGLADNTLKVWDLNGAVELCSLSGHKGAVTACAMTTDGQRVVSTSMDQTIRVWDIASGSCLYTVYGMAGFRCVALRDEWVCAGDEAGNVWMLAWPCDVSDAKPVSPRAVRVFYSCSQSDEGILNKLEAYLRPLQRQGLIEASHAGQIIAGEDWRARVDQQIERADMILLLVSADYLASDYCFEIESRALSRHESGKACVIPIIVRPVDLEQTRFGKLQHLPPGSQPIAKLVPVSKPEGSVPQWVIGRCRQEK